MFRQVLVCLVWCLPVFADMGNEVRDLLQRTERPSIREVADQWQEIESVLGGCGESSYREAEVFMLYRSLLQQVRRDFAEHQRVFFGRDLELLYDAHQLTATAEERERTFLAQISRPLSRNASPSAVVGLMARLGTRIDRLVAGTERVLWLDTGARGSIYHHLLYALYSSLGPLAPPQARENLMRGIEPRLLQSRGRENLGNILLHLRQATDPREVQHLFMDYRGYAELDRELLTRHGIPTDFYGRSRWIVDGIEHTPKWNPRSSDVDGAGEIVFEPVGPRTGEINRARHLCLQVRLIRFFAEEIDRSSTFTCKRVLAAA